MQLYSVKMCYSLGIVGSGQPAHPSDKHHCGLLSYLSRGRLKNENIFTDPCVAQTSALAHIEKIEHMCLLLYYFYYYDCNQCDQIW